MDSARLAQGLKLLCGGRPDCGGAADGLWSGGHPARPVARGQPGGPPALCILSVRLAASKTQLLTLEQARGSLVALPVVTLGAFDMHQFL